MGDLREPPCPTIRFWVVVPKNTNPKTPRIGSAIGSTRPQLDTTIPQERRIKVHLNSHCWRESPRYYTLLRSYAVARQGCREFMLLIAISVYKIPRFGFAPTLRNSNRRCAQPEYARSDGDVSLTGCRKLLPSTRSFLPGCPKS